jgi:hypothetical protein
MNDIKKMKEVALAATPGPWEVCRHLESVEADVACTCGYRGSVFGPDPDVPMAVCQPGHDAEIPGEEGMGPQNYPRAVQIANAQHIAAANPAAVLELIALVERQEAELKEVYDLFGIGSQARTISTLTTSVRNVIKFTDLLHAVEREFFMVPGEPDEDYPDEELQDECLVNCWGSTETQYIEQFRAALAQIAATTQAQCAAPDERAAFAEWFKIEWPLSLFGDDAEKAATEQAKFKGIAWMAFQAGRASLAAQPAKAEAPESSALAILREFISDSQEHDVGGGDVVVTTCEVREKAEKLLNSLRDPSLGVCGVKPVDCPNNARCGCTTPAPAMGEELPPLPDDVALIVSELEQAKAIWPPFNSAHEGFAVLKEEVDELWDEIKVNQKRRDLPKMYKEAKQVAAMALRFMRECCDEVTGRK